MRVYYNGIYRDATAEEMAVFAFQEKEGKKEALRYEIADCKAQLAATDYKAIKYAEGLISEVDYAPVKAERQALRDRINELEKEL